MHAVDTPVDTPPQTQLSCHPRLNRSFQSCHAWPPAGNRRGGLLARCQEQAKTRSQRAFCSPSRCQQGVKNKPKATRSQRAFCSPSLCQQGVKATCCQQGVNKPQKRVVLPVRWCQATKGVEQPGTFYSPPCCQQGVNKSSSREPSTLRHVASKASASSHFHTFAAGSPTRKLKVSALLAASLLST